jgi:tRNA nucleotidyltransferase (CCA-adding enzyme)
MEFFAVGGAVRDELLGLPVRDRDWVVVGATPQQMLAQGYRPVGKDFPVFLHPVTHAASEVTLEQDLARRDLTINAIARYGADGSGDIVDPYDGRRDLADRVLRHVSPAFAEDPVRILRVARFAARFADFTVAVETMTLMAGMVNSGEVDHLVPERVWQELSRGLMETRPSRMFEVLRACGALQRILPELDALWGVPQRADHHPEVDTGIHVMLAIDMAATMGSPLPARFAALTHDLGKGVTPADVLPRHIGHEAAGVRLLGPLCERLRVPSDCRDVALLTARFHGEMGRVEEMRPATCVKLLENCDAIRRPERFALILLACEADYRGRTGYQERTYAAGIDAAGIAKTVAKRCDDSSQIADAIHAARVAAAKSLIEQDHKTIPSPPS